MKYGKTTKKIAVLIFCLFVLGGGYSGQVFADCDTTDWLASGPAVILEVPMTADTTVGRCKKMRYDATGDGVDFDYYYCDDSDSGYFYRPDQCRKYRCVPDEPDPFEAGRDYECNRNFRFFKVDGIATHKAYDEIQINDWVLDSSAFEAGNRIALKVGVVVSDGDIIPFRINQDLRDLYDHDPYRAGDLVADSFAPGGDLSNISPPTGEKGTLQFPVNIPAFKVGDGDSVFGLEIKPYLGIYPNVDLLPDSTTIFHATGEAQLKVGSIVSVFGHSTPESSLTFIGWLDIIGDDFAITPEGQDTYTVSMAVHGTANAEFLVELGHSVGNYFPPIFISTEPHGLFDGSTSEDLINQTVEVEFTSEFLGDIEGIINEINNNAAYSADLEIDLDDFVPFLFTSIFDAGGYNIENIFKDALNSYFVNGILQEYISDVYGSIDLDFSLIESALNEFNVTRNSLTLAVRIDNFSIAVEDALLDCDPQISIEGFDYEELMRWYDRIYSLTNGFNEDFAITLPATDALGDEEDFRYCLSEENLDLTLYQVTVMVGYVPVEISAGYDACVNLEVPLNASMSRASIGVTGRLNALAFVKGAAVSDNAPATVGVSGDLSVGDIAYTSYINLPFNGDDPNFVIQKTTRGPNGKIYAYTRLPYQAQDLCNMASSVILQTAHDIEQFGKSNLEAMKTIGETMLAGDQQLRETLQENFESVIHNIEMNLKTGLSTGISCVQDVVNDICDGTFCRVKDVYGIPIVVPIGISFSFNSDFIQMDFPIPGCNTEPVELYSWSSDESCEMVYPDDGQSCY